MKKILYLIIGILFILILFKTDLLFAENYNSCSSGYYCKTSESVGYTYRWCSLTASGVCGERTEKRHHDCTTSKCLVGDYDGGCSSSTPFEGRCETVWSSTSTGCCEEGEPCTPYIGCSCGSLATSNQGYGSKSVSCGDGCGGSTSSACYCKTECSSGNPLTCPTNSSSSPQGTGNFTVSCSNDCETSTKTCYCPAANCSDYTDESGISWYDTCPLADPSECRTASIDVPIPNRPHTSCDDSQTKTCYNDDNKRPEIDTSSVQIVPASNISGFSAYLNNNIFLKLINKVRAAGDFTDQILHFTSQSHSGRGQLVAKGGGVNNPVGLTATYTDTDGQDDIVAIYVWWKAKAVPSLNVPNKIASNSAHSTENNWGFLISRDFGGNWDEIYVPSITQKTWRPLGDLNSTRYIKGPDNNMVELQNISVTSPDGRPNDIDLQLTMKFLNESGNDIVTTDKYDLWALANDYVGFTQFETDGNIKDSGNEFWKDSDKDWNLDMVKPDTYSIASITDTKVGEVTVSINVGDNDNISYVRLDACKSGVTREEDIDDLTSNLLTGPYTLKSCDDFYSIGDEIDMKSGNSLLGNYGHSPTNPYFENVIVDLKGNKEGSITFYLTVMDDAGNFEQIFEIYRLEQWAMVKNGFVFGKGGVTSSSRLVEADNWNGHAILDGFEELSADISDQVLMGGTPSTTTFLRALERYKVNKSFKVAKYPGILMTTPYAELMSAYTQKAANNTSFEYHRIDGNTLSGNLLAECPDIATDPTKDYCILETQDDLTDDLTINSDFECDGKGLIIAKGNITIKPDLTSEDSADHACIILSGGNINIQAKRSPGVVGALPEYDEVHAYLIANGEIVIEKYPTPSTIDSSFNQAGLYVKGGLSAFTPNSSNSAVYNEREMYFGHMGIYPVLIVENNAKYGFLSKGVFGSQIDIFKLEIGWKPF